MFKNGGEIIDYDGDNTYEDFEDYLIHELNDLDEVILNLLHDIYFANDLIKLA